VELICEVGTICDREWARWVGEQIGECFGSENLGSRSGSKGRYDAMSAVGM
jgi:hypothetical protein